ncbi:MAG: WG repeat-containing protein [Oscillospiraceae bacterium]|nr:WG repeat-containing protein [Oscillospiraceae bacterium]
MFRRILTLALALALTLSLAACGGKDEAVGGSNTSSGNSSSDGSDSGKSAETAKPGDSSNDNEPANDEPQAEAKSSAVQASDIAVVVEPTIVIEYLENVYNGGQTMPEYIFNNGRILVTVEDGSVPTKHEKGYCFLDTQGNFDVDTSGIRFDVDSAKPKRVITGISEGLTVFEDEDLANGYKDESGTVVIPAKYYMAYPFSEGLALVQENQGGLWGFIDKSGNTVIPFEYDTPPYNYGEKRVTMFVNEAVVYGFTEGLAAVSKDGKSGYIDKNGNAVIPFIYDKAAPFSEGLAAVLLNEKWGFIDKNGNMVLEPQYTFGPSKDTSSYDYGNGVPFFRGGYAFVLNQNNSFVLIDKDGNKLEIPDGYRPDGGFNGGVAVISQTGSRDDKTSAIINTNGEILDEGFTFILQFSEGYTLFSKEPINWGTQTITAGILHNTAYKP